MDLNMPRGIHDRTGTCYARGEACPQARLCADDVRDIRRRKGEKQMALAAEFGCSESNIGQIHQGKIWKHLL
jgi:hypothetical protein